MTTAILSNTTSPGSSLAVGDAWELQIKGAPNQDVYATGSFPNGETFHTKFGTTDAEGNFTDTGTEAEEHIGPWVITWSVGNEAAPTMRFDVSATRETAQVPPDTEQTIQPAGLSIPLWAWILGGAAVAYFAFGRKA